MRPHLVMVMVEKRYDLVACTCGVLLGPANTMHNCKNVLIFTLTVFKVSPLIKLVFITVINTKIIQVY